MRCLDDPTATALRAAFAALLFCLPIAAVAESDMQRDVEELWNPLLGFEYSHWLVGPVAFVATDSEIESYLALVDDDEASAFIDAFWAERAQGTRPFAKSPQQLFEERASIADARFAEGTRQGRITDRGTLYVIYGEPNDISFESPKRVGAPTLEVWSYAPATDDEPRVALDGREPRAIYRFVREGDSVIFYRGGSVSKARERLRRLRGGS